MTQCQLDLDQESSQDQSVGIRFRSAPRIPLRPQSRTNTRLLKWRCTLKRMAKNRPLSRSEIMSRVGQRDTGPELALRRVLWRQGLRYRKNYRIEGIKVDIVILSARLAIFVDGCYWHQCPIHGTRPSSNAAFWIDKFRTNKARDERQGKRLKAAGWSVLRLWEHECRRGCDSALHAIMELIRRP